MKFGRKLKLQKKEVRNSRRLAVTGVHVNVVIIVTPFIIVVKHATHDACVYSVCI